MTNTQTTPASVTGSASGMIIREREPVNFEFPFDRLDSYLTPNELFYIRSHFKAPTLNAKEYELRIEGAVRNAMSLSYDDLMQLPSETQVATLECAGNSRIFLVPQNEGAQWELGAVGNAEWMGVPLRTLLEKANLEEDVVEIIFEGADCGKPKQKPLPPNPISYARSLLLKRALQSDVLVAYRMNGKELPPDHGFPVRLIVPGHYGMASVKWLTKIQAVKEAFQGYWQTSDYAFWEEFQGKPVRRPLSDLKLKSQIARPALYEVLKPETHYSVVGAAWSGSSDVARVDFSADGGKTWMPTEFLDVAQRSAWRRWTTQWQVPNTPGKQTLMSRATDSSGATQPQQHDPNYGSYVINHCLAIDIFIGSA